MLKFEPGKIVKTHIDFDPKKRAVIPVFVFAPKNATEKTPRIFISSGTHGNEVNGIMALKLIRDKLDINKLKKIVYFIPILNQTAYWSNDRRSQIDAKDLNRNFIETRNVLNKKTFTIRLADAFIDKIVRDCEFGIDLHDAGERNVLAVHARAHIGKSAICRDGCTLDIAKQTGLKLILQRKGIKGMLARTAWRHFKRPVLTIEIGGGGVIWNKYLQQTKTAVFNVLKANNAYIGRPKIPKTQYIIIKQRKEIPAPISGIMNILPRLGQTVENGDKLAVIYDPASGKQKTVKSDKCGIIFSKRLKVFVHQGEAIISVLQTSRCWIHKEEDFEGGIEIINNDE